MEIRYGIESAEGNMRGGWEVEGNQRCKSDLKKIDIGNEEVKETFVKHKDKMRVSQCGKDGNKQRKREYRLNERDRERERLGNVVQKQD